MWCFSVFVCAIHNEFTVSVVSFDIAGTLKKKVRVALPASAAQPQKIDLTSRESSEILAANSVVRDPAVRGNFPFGPHKCSHLQCLKDHVAAPHKLLEKFKDRWG